MPSKTLGEIARLIDGDVTGDKEVVIAGISAIRDARPGDITFVANRKYVSMLESTEASAAVVGRDAPEVKGLPLIRVDDPDRAFIAVAQVFSPEPLRFYQGIHPTAVIGEDVEIGPGASIQAFAVVQDGVKIGDGTLVQPGAYIGHYSTIGKNCCIYPRVVVRERVTIGDNVIIHSGASIGSDGFGYFTVEGRHRKIPQLGSVTIEDDVEIGANTCIDRARFGKTIVRRGTKIDNLVQLGHNVSIGEDTLIVSQVGVAGSTTIGSRCMVAGQTAFAGHVAVGDHIMLAGRAGVTKDIKNPGAYGGYPAMEHTKELKLQSLYRKLPEMAAAVKDLQKRLEESQKTVEALNQRIEELEAKPEYHR